MLDDATIMAGGTIHRSASDGALAVQRRSPARRGWRHGLAHCVRAAVATHDGNALVETAVTLPLLLIVMLGLLQFALYAHAAHVVTTAVQVGARVGAFDGQPLQAAVGRTQEVLRAGLGSDAETLAVQARDGGDVVVVEARGRLRLVIPWVADTSLPLDARAVASKERFRPGGRSL